MKYISKVILLLTGWKVIVDVPSDLKQYVLLSVPHTSNWDFFYGRISLYAKGVKMNFLIKKELFFFPLGILLKSTGAIPIDRGRNNNVINEVVKQFKKNDDFRVLITPEGTRKLQKNWKRGFYQIALAANVPLILGSIDYSKKLTEMKEVFYPTGDYEKDMVFIENYYRGMVAKYPEKFNLS